MDIHTPPYIFAGIPLTFDLDPASPLSGPVTPARYHYTPEQDGLAQPWFGMVWLNPPYNRREIGKWIAKLAEHGRGVVLVYARTDTAWTTRRVVFCYYAAACALSNVRAREQFPVRRRPC